MDADAREPWRPSFDDNSPWRWEWWKFGFAPQDLFESLAKQYNTAPYWIQSYQAFHHDVNEIVREARDLDDFHRRLAIRRDERLQELRKAWDDISIRVVMTPSIFDNMPDNWDAFRQFSWNRSMDSLILFFQSLLASPHPVAPSLQTQQLPDSAPVNSTQPSHPTSQHGLQADPASSDMIDAGRITEYQEALRIHQKRENTRTVLRPNPNRREVPRTLTRGAAVAKRQHKHARIQGDVIQLHGNARSPLFGQQQKQLQHPAQRTEALKTPRRSRRLAGQRPEFETGRAGISPSTIRQKHAVR
ncbi:hypothetical protein VTG60DRAFT_4069 [Thermothelomyces hinnuleus]